MPIKPENKKRYPPNWAEIRGRILQRAGYRCEQCGVANHALAATMLPRGITVGDFMRPQVEESIRTGKMPELLPGLSAETRLLLGAGEE